MLTKLYYKNAKGDLVSYITYTSNIPEMFTLKEQPFFFSLKYKYLHSTLVGNSNTKILMILYHINGLEYNEKMVRISSK